MVFKVTKFTAYWLAFAFLMVAYWINRKFGSPTFEQIIYHLEFGADGLIESDANLIKSFVKNCLLYPVPMAAFTYYYQAHINSRTLNKLTSLNTASKNNKINFSIKIEKLIYRLLLEIFSNKFPLYLITFSIFFLLYRLAFLDFVVSLQESKIDIYSEHYIAPTKVVAPKIKQNLVLIYVESLENGMANSDVMGRNLIAPLEQNFKNQYKFKNYEPAYGTGWTIAGIVSTQCGIPLKSLSAYDGNDEGEKMRLFLPGAICLGDILNAHGYNNVFLQGAPLDFSGTGKFFSQHGYRTVYGKTHWETLGEKNFNGWGLYDDKLFEYAKKELKALEKSKHPFNLTLSTIDTHFPGHINPTCKKNGVVDYKGIVTCTSELVADFIGHMKKEGYLKNTVVVILGDHLAMTVPIHDELVKSGHRTIFNLIIAPENLEKNTDNIYPYSMLPTTLYALGFRFKDNRLALGASGFGPRDQSYQPMEIDQSLLARSSRGYSRFLESKN